MSRTVTGLGLVTLLSSSVALAEQNEAGINVNYLNDSDDTPLLADMIRTYRTVNLTGSSFSANDAKLDANGWATSDAWYFLGDPAAITHGDGTFSLKFNGQATVQFGTIGKFGSSTGKILSQTYDPITNTTNAILETKKGTDLTELRFVNTKRDAASATNTGVTNVSLMRPTMPGGNTPYAFGTTFTNQTVEISKKVSALRFMDYLATNNNIQTAWSDRVKPTEVKLNPNMPRSSRGRGGPLELAVELGNTAGRDIWINVPALADDDYITKMAQLIKYGSDGTNPYTSPQANPVFKPLNPGLKVYVEYSNETWNGQFLQQDQIHELAKQTVTAETAAGGIGPISYTNTTNEYYLTERYNALRTKQIADTFEGVFGSSAMMNTVRPILAWQYGNGNDTANQAVSVLDGYFNNSKGSFVAAPKPINSYIYGGGSANYYSPSSGLSELTVDKIMSESIVQTAARTAKIVKDIAYTTTFGIKRVGYEGGLSLDPGASAETTESMAAKLAALADPRMKQVVVTNHNTWTNQGGDLLVYYFASDQYKFGYTDNEFNTDTPKLNGLAEISATQETTAFSVGKPLSRTAATTLLGGQWNLRDTFGNNNDGPMNLKATGWSSYLIHVPEAGDYSLSASFKTYGKAASFEIHLGGAVLADYLSLLSEGKYSSTGGIRLTLPAGITSVRILMNPGSGDISLNSVSFVPLDKPPAVPEPTGLAALAVGGAALLRRRRVTRS